MNSKMTTNSQLSTTEAKIKQTKQTTRTGTESQKWRSHGGCQQVGLGGEWGKCTGNKYYKWQVQNRQGEVKNSLGNGEVKELICMTHGHELRWEGGMQVRGGYRVEHIKGGGECDKCNSIINKIY